MIAKEVMMQAPVVLHPDMTVGDALADAARSELDVLPVVDASGRYMGTVPKSALADQAADTGRKVSSLCCSDALLCEPETAIEHFQHDAVSAVPHRTIVVVGRDGRFHGVIPSVHWAVDEAKVQSGHPRSPLEVRTSNMHLIWRCLECGELAKRNDGIPAVCPSCGADSGQFCLHTED